MGSVFRWRGKWCVEYLADGKHIRKVVSDAMTKTKAKEYLRKMEEEISNNKYLSKEMAFEMWADRCQKWSKINKRSWKRDELSNKYLKAFFKGKKLEQISPMLVESYKDERIKRVKGATVNRELACLKHMMNLAINEDLILKNPVKRVRFFREEEAHFMILSSSEKEKLIRSSNDYVRDAVVIALNTGMRRGEILSLMWKNIDFIKDFIRVENTKSGKPRAIPMNSVVKNTLLDKAKKNDHPEYVFWNKKWKNPIHDIKNGFRAACSKAGIGRIRFHDLRHTFASDLVMNGVDLVTVSQILGHSNISITAKRYSHPTPTHKIKAVESLVGKPSDFQEKNSQNISLTNKLTEPQFKDAN